MESFGCMLAVRTPEASLNTCIPHPEFLPSPLGDKVGYFHLDRFRGYLAVHCCSGLQPPGLRFAMSVAGHHARLGTRLRARLCRGLHFRKLNSTSFQGTTPHGSGRALISASGSYLGRVTAKRTACPHTRPPWDTRSPALSRVRVEWKSVLLEPQPSLPTLRRRAFRLCSNGSSLLCRSVTPRRRTRGPCGLGLLPPSCD